MTVLVIDVGGTHIKILASGKKQPRKVESGPTMTAAQMATAVKQLAAGWKPRRTRTGCRPPKGDERHARIDRASRPIV